MAILEGFPGVLLIFAGIATASLFLERPAPANTAYGALVWGCLGMTLLTGFFGVRMCLKVDCGDNQTRDADAAKSSS